MMGNDDVREKYLKELEQSVQIYDAMVKTGNEALDTLLTEKSLYCEAHGIKISCVVDGKSLAFLDPVDLYAILGNALDNAVEGVSGFSDKTKTSDRSGGLYAKSVSRDYRQQPGGGRAAVSRRTSGDNQKRQGISRIRAAEYPTYGKAIRRSYQRFRGAWNLSPEDDYSAAKTGIIRKKHHLRRKNNHFGKGGCKFLPKNIRYA